jgi:hypothetical protein
VKPNEFAFLDLKGPQNVFWRNGSIRVTHPEVDDAHASGADASGFVEQFLLSHFS